MDPLTVKEFIEELQKLPQDAPVFAVVTSLQGKGTGIVDVVHLYKPAHARLHVSGAVHVLGRLG